MSSLFSAKIGPSDIVPCADCPFNNGAEERVFSPTRTFIASFDQRDLPRDQQTGASVTKVNLLEKGLIQAAELRDGFDSFQRLNDLPQSDDDFAIADENGLASVFLKHVDAGIGRLQEVSTGQWNQFAEAGCPGPEEGGRKFIVCGDRKVSCGVVNFIQRNALEWQ